MNLRHSNFIFRVKVHFENIEVTFEFLGHRVNMQVTAAKKRPRAGMCSPWTQFVRIRVCMCLSVTTIVKTYGAHLKASAATVRLRLYDVLALLPAETYEGI